MSDNTTPASTCCCSGPVAQSENLVTDLTARNLLAPGPSNQTTCPVMPGTPVNTTDAEAAGLFRDYGGRRYWFCCAGCGPRFDRDPDRYASAA